LRALQACVLAKQKVRYCNLQKFFNELWAIYTQLRVDSLFSFGRDKDGQVIEKDLFIMITAEGGFSGDIDQKVLRMMLQEYDAERNEIIVIGHHGAVQMSQRGIAYKKYFKLPEKDQNINVAPIIREVIQYRSTKVFYQEYISLSLQEVKSIELGSAIKERAEGTPDEDTISEDTYIFEPST